MEGRQKAKAAGLGIVPGGTVAPILVWRGTGDMYSLYVSPLLPLFGLCRRGDLPAGGALGEAALGSGRDRRAAGLLPARHLAAVDWVRHSLDYSQKRRVFHKKGL